MKRLSIFFAALMACTLSFAQTTFEKVTAAPADWSGEYLLVYENSATEAFVFNGLDAAKGYTAATIADGKITANDLVTITIAATTEKNYSIKVNGSDNDGKYISGTSDSNKLNFADKASDNTISYESDGVMIVSNTSVMRFNAASDQMRYRYYKSKQYTRQKPVQLYKKATGGETPVAVESVALDKAELSIAAGKTATLVATITPANATNKSVTWTTDNDKVATVADGVVTAVAEGKANITVTTADGAKTATCAVTVTAASQAVDVTIYSVDFTKAAEAKTWTIDDKEKASLDYVWQQTTSYGMKASAYVSGKNNATESWLISPAIDFSRAESATMTFNHARKFGSNDHLSVKATTDGGSTWNDLTVSEWPDGNSWDFIEATADLSKLLGSAKAQIAFVYTSTSSSAATWEIKNLTINGTETYVPATGITLSTTALTMQKYKYISLIATVTPATTTDAVVWKSDNEEVATVSEKGVVTAVATGTANITATAGKYSATCAITVEEATFITCAQAVEIASKVSGDNVPAEGGMYVIRGYVTAYEGTPADDMETYKNYSAWLADTKGDEGTFMAYQVKPVDGTTVAAVGDLVEVVGDITQYDGTYETMGRGTATIKVIPDTTTALDNNTVDEVVVEKVIRDGQVLIIRDGNIYNLMGKEIE